MRDRETKRSRTDLYAQVLEVLIRYPEGGKITRLSYGVGVPIDRLRTILEALQQLWASQKIRNRRPKPLFFDAPRLGILGNLLENEGFYRNIWQ
jgi:predicted transcriptional regulator